MALTIEAALGQLLMGRDAIALCCNAWVVLSAAGCLGASAGTLYVSETQWPNDGH